MNPNTKGAVADYSAGCALATPNNEAVLAAMADLGIIGGTFHVECRDANGKLEWECDAKNALFTEGAAYIRDYVFNLNTPAAATALQMGLSTTNGLAASVTFASIAATEPGGGGYTRKAVTWTSVAGPPAGANNVANAVVWTATGTQIVGVYELFVVAQSNSKVIAHALLTGGPYTVNVNSTLTVTYTWSVA
jgi:hypothetical protein